MKSSDAVKSLGALAQAVRLQAFRSLVVAGPTGLTPGTMAESLGIPANSLSFHLKALTYAGLVSSERVSRNIVYRANIEHINALIGYLTENCCAGTACAVDVNAVQCVC